MNRWTRRVSVALASAAMAGGALLAAGGSASAATLSQPEHTVSSPAGHHGHHEGRYVRDDHNERDDGWHRHRGSSTDDAYRAHHHDRRHRTGDVRRVGHHRYVWNGNRWVEVTPWRRIGVDRWYLDQIVWYLNQR